LAAEPAYNKTIRGRNGTHPQLSSPGGLKMVRKMTVFFLLPAFCLFSLSCASRQVRGPSEIGSFSSRTAILSVVIKSGDVIECRKSDPGRVVPGGGIAGKTLQNFDVNVTDIKKLVRDKKGTPVRLYMADGSVYDLVSYAEEGDKIHLSAYAPITIPISDIQQIWIRKTDSAKSIWAGAGIIAGGVLILGVISMIAFVHWLESSCPYVYSWNGEEYVLDAEPYGAAISEGLKRTDWVELSELREDGGEYRVVLANELDETEFTDELKIVAVDHAPGVKVAPDLAGGFHTFSDPLPPMRAVDQTGRDILTFVKTNDRAFWLSDLEGRNPDGDGEFRDELVFEFPKPAGAKQAKLLANVWTTRWGSLSAGMFLEHYGTSLPDKYAEVDSHGPMYAKFMNWVATEELAALKIWVETPAGWKARSMIMGGAPVITKDKAYVLSVADIPGETLRVKLRPPVNFWMVNSLAVDYGDDSAVQVTELAAEKAVDHTGRDVRAELASTDRAYLVSPNRGERTKLAFAAPPLKEGLVRTMFIKASGYYRTHLDATGEPQTALAERILREPGFAARYSFRQYLKWEAGVRAEAERAKR
jgi:hypothetical protein